MTVSQVCRAVLRQGPSELAESISDRVVRGGEAEVTMRPELLWERVISFDGRAGRDAIREYIRNQAEERTK